MTFSQLRKQIRDCKDKDFQTASDEMQSLVFSMLKNDIAEIITEIGVIPEDIAHDSSEEKLYSKTSDIIFAKALECIGFDVNVLRERANAADIVARSKFHNYSLVGDAKVFRLSRTAKNAKDFKVDSMDRWRGSEDFSVLACPYFQYPTRKSQIYKEALDGNVMLFSWEWLYIMLKEDVKETQIQNLREIWNQSAIIAQRTTVANTTKCFMHEQDKNICHLLGISEGKYVQYFDQIKRKLQARGQVEILYYEGEIRRVKNMDRDEAIKELLEKMNLESKIEQIKGFIDKITKE